MSGSAARAALMLTVFWIISPSRDASSQGVSVDVSAGHVVFEPVSSNVGTSNVAGTLRYETLRGVSVYGTAAAPLGTGDSVWGVLGAEGRVMPGDTRTRRAAVGLDLAAHGYLFRDAVLDRTGTGGTLEAVPFVSLPAGAARIELRGGWRGHTLSYAGTSENRGVLETGARAAYGTVVRVQGEARWVRAAEGTFPFVGGTLSYAGGPVQAWVQGGKWVSADLDEAAWGAGIGIPLGARAMVWATAQQHPPDPLYWNASRRSWSVGLTRRFGSWTPLPPSVPRQDAGGVVIRVAASDAPGDELSIAGDFNNWQPVPMQREGGDWIIHLPLAAGVYHYAFRSARGDWFVPASAAGRRDDGMGGQVAVLVVS